MVWTAMLARYLLPEFELACEFLAHQYKLTGSGELFVAVSESLLETVAKAKTIFAFSLHYSRRRKQ